MGTQIAAVRVGLLAGLAELPEFTQEGPTGQIPDLSFSFKTGWKAREKIWTQRASFEHEPAGMRSGTTFYDETGEFELMIAVHGIGLSLETAFTRVSDLFTAAQEWAAYKPNWNAPAMVPGIYEFQIVGRGEIPEGIGENGEGLAEARIPVRYRARI